MGQSCTLFVFLEVPIIVSNRICLAPSHLQVGTNMAEYLSTAKAECPFVLMLGEDHQCSQAFVIINGTALEHPTLLGAVDGCLKAFFVFDIQYPHACAQVWEFIQTVYELPGPVRPCVKVMRAQFGV